MAAGVVLAKLTGILCVANLSLGATYRGTQLTMAEAMSEAGASWQRLALELAQELLECVWSQRTAKGALAHCFVAGGVVAGHA